jgi:hypothetical protein
VREFVYARPVRSLSLAVPLLLALLACESTSAPVVTYERTVTPEMVTGSALAALRPDGRLQLELPATTGDQLSLAEARTQSLGFARYVTNNVLLRGMVEGSRGGYWTDPHLLTICEDAYYVHSQFGAITHDSLGESGLSILKRYGPRWLIPMCGSANEPQMRVQVAIDGNSERFPNGEPTEPYVFLYSAWHASGVPLNWPDALTISVERAVRFAYETFGVRVAEVPQLIMRGEFAPDGSWQTILMGHWTCHRWRIVLESVVGIRGMSTLTTDTTKVVYVGALTCSGFDVTPYIHLPLAAQPMTSSLNFLDTACRRRRPGRSPCHFRRRLDSRSALEFRNGSGPRKTGARARSPLSTAEDRCSSQSPTSLCDVAAEAEFDPSSHSRSAFGETMWHQGGWPRDECDN